MSLFRAVCRSNGISIAGRRPLSISLPRHLAAAPRPHDNAADWEKTQKSKSNGPHLTNTNSTIANEMPSVGADKPPPELLSSVDPDFAPKDSVPENTERMTGGTQQGAPQEGVNAELDVGEMEGAKFKVEPLRRTGEDGNTMRARLLCLFDYLYNIDHLGTIVLTQPILLQTRVARGELSRVIFSSPLLPIIISRT